MGVSQIWINMRPGYIYLVLKGEVGITKQGIRTGVIVECVDIESTGMGVFQKSNGEYWELSSIRVFEIGKI